MTEYQAVLKIRNLFNKWFIQTLSQIVQSEKKILRKVEMSQKSIDKKAPSEAESMHAQQLEGGKDFLISSPNDIL